MLNWQDVITIIFFSLWLITIFFAWVKSVVKPWTATVIQLALMVIMVYLLHKYFHFLDFIQTMGDRELTGWDLLWLFLSTVAGLMAHQLFIQLKDAPAADAQKRQGKIRFIPILKPMLVAPIIFMVVLNMIGVSEQPLAARVVQYLAAYQAGFFWKIFLDQQMSKASSADLQIGGESGDSRYVIEEKV